VSRIVPTLFARPVPFVALSLLLYALLGAWFVLMLIRNIKKDTEQIRLLSRWQAIGFAAFINLLLFAFLDPARIFQIGTLGGYHPQLIPTDVMNFVVATNGLIFVLIGIAMLAPQERLKVWWRKHAAGEEGYLSESGPPWPWLIPAAAVAYLLLVVQALSLRSSIQLSNWKLGTAALELVIFLVFATRDVLFLQWAILTRMKRPVVKGILYLWLYYTSAGIVSAVMGAVGGQAEGSFLAGLLTPFGILASRENSWHGGTMGAYAGLGLQILLILLLSRVMSVRLRRPALVPALSEG
jgi:hypothetical protein